MAWDIPRRSHFFDRIVVEQSKQAGLVWSKRL
jgi:hypothetical protein